MPEWPNAQELHAVHVSVGGHTLFAGPLDKPAYSVDQRSVLLEVYAPSGTIRGTLCLRQGVFR